MMESIKVSWLTWLPQMTPIRAAQVVLYWKFMGIAASSLTLTLLCCLRDRIESLSRRHFLQRLVIGQCVILGVVLLCASLTVFGLSKNADTKWMIAIIWYSSAIGLVLGWLFSAGATIIHVRICKCKRKHGRELTERKSVCLTGLAFALLLLIGLINRYTLFLPLVLTKGHFQNDITWIDDGLGVYDIDEGIFPVEMFTDMQHSSLLVYEEPKIGAEIVAEIPAGTIYQGFKVAELTRPTTRLGWRYLPDEGGYALTTAIMRAFWNSRGLYMEYRRSIDPTYTEDVSAPGLMLKAFICRQSIMQVVSTDEYAYLTGQAITHDLCFWMSPLSLLAWLAGVMATALYSIKRVLPRRYNQRQK